MRRYFLPLSILILLVAAALRLAGLHLYPPGPHYDEAVYLLITRSIAFGGARPFPIVEAYQGREVLYMYLNAPLLHLWGDHIFTLRVSSVLLNLLTIAASIGLGRAMFRGRRGLAVGVVIGLLMALSFPQIWLARQAFRAVTLPFCQAVALYALWRGLTASRRSWWWQALGGLFAGLALYTYMASRLFPLWLALGGLVLLVTAGRERGLRLRQGLIFFGVLLVVIAPMAVYAIEKPDIFLGRLSEVTQPEQSVSLAESILLHTRMFFIEGDPYLRYNIPGRPYFTPVEGLLLLAGLVVATVRLARPGPATERAACALALLAPLMVLPSVISVGGLPPSHMRSLGMIPLIFVPVALGAVALGRAIARHLQLVDTARLAAAGVLAVLAIGGLLVGGEYFSWASRADLYYETDADLAAAAQWVTAHAGADTLVYVAARDRGHPTYLVEANSEPAWLGTSSLFRPPPGRTGLAIFPRSAPPPDDWADWLEPGRVTDLPLGPDGRTAFEAFRLDGDTPLPTMAPLPPESGVNRFLAFAGALTWPVEAGAAVDSVTAWTVRETPDTSDLTPLLQLETMTGIVLARADAYMTQTDRWRVGEVLMQRIPLRVPAGTPPGRYLLLMAWVARADNRYLPYTNGRVWEAVNYLDVRRPAIFPDPASLPIEVRAPTDVAPGVRLLGWNAPPERARPGEGLLLTLFWQAAPYSGTRAPFAPELLLSREGELTAFPIGDADERYDADQWIDGEVVRESERVRLPRDLAAGEYALELRAGETVIPLGQLRIEGQPRLFDAPPAAHLNGTVLDGAIELYGYDVAQAGDELDLTLVWRSVRAVDQDYTVFVHVLDDAGQIVAQHDSAPASGSYPTSLWTPGEFVVDTHQFTGLNPAAAYRIAVGFYSQLSGERLRTEWHDGASEDSIVIRNIEKNS